MIYKPHRYQQHSFEHLIKFSGSGLFAEMGLGKTVVALTVADYHLNETLEVSKVLVIGPKKVCESVWMQEGQKWDHLQHLRFSLILGSEGQRKRALNKKADVYVINRENVSWLVSLCQGKFPFDMVIVDESTSFKSHEAKRFRALKAVLPAVKRIIILSGAPMPNSILDLWSQIYLLDRGQRLGESFAKFRDKYYEKEPYKTFVYKLRNSDIIDPDFYQKEISEKISDICISLHAKDYLELPERIDNIIKIELDPADMKKYEDFERDQVFLLPDDKDITAINAAALTNKLLQFANGAMYDENHDFHVMHNAKLDYLEEIIDTANGEPVLVFYSYQHDLFRITERLKKYKPKLLLTDKEVQAWNRKEIPLLLAHPASVSWGLNLQAGGNIIIWFGLGWNLEHYLQSNARLVRQGQLERVIIHHLLVNGTMDFEVYQALQGKDNRQKALMNAIKAKIDKYLKEKRA